MGKTIIVNEDRCLGCLSCSFACAVAHSEQKTVLSAVRADLPARSRVHVEPAGRGGVPVQCRHCEDAPCVIVCPKEALRRLDPDGPVLLDADRCTGCGFCVLVCPYGAIELTDGDKVPIKCDACIERTKAGEAPACVVACPTGALAFAEPDDDARSRRRRQAERVAADAAKHAGAPAPDQKKVTCELCGAPVAPAKQLQFVRSKLPDGAVAENVCTRCRRRRAAVLAGDADERPKEE